MSESSTKRPRINDNDINEEDQSPPPDMLGHDDEQSSDGRNWTNHGDGGGGGGGYRPRREHAPSKVVHIRNLNDTVVEADVKNDLARFGHINKTLFMYKKRQALVEYEDLQSAIKCVSEASKFSVRVGGTPAYINFSPYNNLTKHE